MLNPRLLISFGFFLLVTTNALECPDRSIRGFLRFHTAPCYLFERFPTQFVTAERMCRLSGGHLASIPDGFVNAFVAHAGNEAFLIMEEKDFWLGGNNLVDQDTWNWVDGEKWGQYTKWDTNEPNNNTMNRCTSMKLIDGKWKAENCFDRKPYVCELPYANGNGSATVFPVTPKWLTTTPRKVETEPWATTIAQTTPEEQTTLLTDTPEPTTLKLTTLKQTTTLEPSTPEPTLEPTTQKVTLEPSTPEPTLEPTTQKVTLEPTTQKVTLEPTTQKVTLEPSTVKPTTLKLTTLKQTTVEPTTTQKLTTLTSTSEEPTTTLPPTPVCPDKSWKYANDGKDGGNNLCYHVYLSNGNWKADKEYCEEELSGTLISIHKTPKFLRALLYKPGATQPKGDVTIGLQEQIVDGLRQWTWVDQTVVDYTDWLQEPKPAKDGDALRCATYYTDISVVSPKYGKWKTVDCNSTQGRVVCQVEPVFEYEPSAIAKKTKISRDIKLRKH